ncbi:hypothetical protein CFAM422_000528 [Trichoderma lentiforme]|uniref:Uncharacterized protein n=1 Tax=Trichoderma lentiforme TaxID=1567552 RepID=A0A9P4XRB0_9HYPO|nr:hypothetical protein CFAM422_000528 [Trichoderma lentiforme]
MAVARATSTKFQKGSLHTQATKTPYQKFSILVASGFRGPAGEGKRLGGGAGNKVQIRRPGRVEVCGPRYCGDGGYLRREGFVRARGSDDKKQTSEESMQRHIIMPAMVWVLD